MMVSVPQTRDVVLVGGGHTHALVLRKWGMRPVPGARLTLIHPGPTAPYSGMLPGHIAGHYARDALEIDIVRLARFAGARLIIGKAEAVDRTDRTVTVTGQDVIGYDILALDIGVTSEMPQIPGFAAHVLPAKPLDRLADGWAQFATDAPQGAAVVVIGGGVAGVELALAAQHRLREMAAKVTLIERGDALSALPEQAARTLRHAMQDAGITLIEGAAVAEVSAGELTLEDGRRIGFDCAIGAAGARPHDWVGEIGIRTENGFLVVDEYLRSVDDPTLYASGDCAHLAHAPRPKAGVFAVRAAPVLAHNLAADLTGAQRKAFRPQSDYLKLISLGRKAAFGEKAGLRARGPWVWQWKDRIDQAFMDQFRTLPEMPRAKAPPQAAQGVAKTMAGPALCGGCGAKLSTDVLGDTLAALPSNGRADVEMGAGDDAALLKIGAARQVITTDHLRAFTLDPGLHARITALHAMGDIWAMGAKPQAALAQITLPALAEPLQRRTLHEIMQTASNVFQAEGAQIVGGHSTQGAELQIGFTITGLLDGPAIRTEGGKAGDALILTRPLGTGVILAAEMAARAPGPVVAEAWALMARPQGDAAMLLAPDAHAMTDVTGFGLAGHLSAMCRAAGLGAELDLAAVPLMQGALDLSQSGIASTLMPANRDAVAVRGADDPRAALLFDPQTAGGFLAAVPAARAKPLVSKLQKAGHGAALIGRLLAGPATITLR